MTTAPEKIQELVKKFSKYKKSNYNETTTRVEYIDPLFIALGWDVHNDLNTSYANRDVIHEDAIKVGGSTKAPDYSFRIDRKRKFFVEAKRPSINIDSNKKPSYQLRRYGWSAQLPLGVVTDFEEFAVYDCRIKPKENDKSTVARVAYFTYDQYIDHWGEISSLFSKESVKEGSLDKYPVKKNYARKLWVNVSPKKLINGVKFLLKILFCTTLVCPKKK
jgi:hypothetical protein